MYRIMIADDEGIAIDSLTLLLKKEFGEEIMLESARSGRHVIELAETFRPDIAIMDIHMPGINGIEAMREIRRSNDRIVFIVVSAYDTFDYAKEAIGLGVLEYLNKPVARDELLSVVKKAMRQIDHEREKRSQDLLVREKLETVVPVLESGLIYNLLLRECYQEDIDNYRNLLGIEATGAYMLVLVFGQEQEGSHMTNAAGISVRLQEQTTLIRETVREFFPGIVGSVMANKVPVLVPCEEEEPDYNARLAMQEKAQRLVEKLGTGTGVRVRVGLGGVHSLKEAVLSYNEALDSLTLVSDSVVMTADLPVGVDYEENYPVETEHKLFDCVEKGDATGALHCAGQYFDWMTDSYGDYLMDIKLKVLEFVLWSEHLAYYRSGSVYEFRSRENYLPSLLELEGIGNIRQWFFAKITGACEWVASRSQRQADSVVDRAKVYIEEHFGQDISLDEVSRSVDISPFYFSKLFKEGTGCTFIEYLTNLRISKARDLIEHSDLSMKEIGQSVGYVDPNYFSRIFKKNVGVTPTDYKGQVG